MTDQDVQIRKATSNDIPSIVELNLALFQEDAGPRDPCMNLNWPKEEGYAHFSKLISCGDSVCLLATSGNETIGYLAGYLWNGGSLRPLKMAELESMYVRQPCRSQGVGQQLVDEFVQWARQRDVQRISVTAYAANICAIAFYQGLGFGPKCLSLEKGID